MLDIITAPRKGTPHRLQNVSWQKGVNLTKSATATATTGKKTEWTARNCLAVLPLHLRFEGLRAVWSGRADK